MDPQNYDVVFNLAQEPYRGWIPAAFPLIFVIIGIAIFFMGERGGTKVLGLIGATFAILVTVAVQLGGWQQYQRLQRSFHEGRFSDVEDYVRDFQPNPRDPSDSDIFHIGAHRFEVFHTTNSAYNGTVNLNHRCVRVFYTDRNEIIWLGIRKSGCEPMEALQPEADDTSIGFWDP